MKTPTTDTDCADPRWVLDELSAVVGRVLGHDYNGAANRQIRAVPNARTLRYYTTIGLLDRPAEMRGRTALYGWRHLLQVIAVKRLQEQGLTLVDIQQRLIGRPDDALAAIAELPAKPSSEWVGTAVTVGRSAETTAARELFWKQAPAGSTTDADTAAVGMRSVALTPDVLLVWSGLPTASDAALREAAAALLKELRRRGVIAPSQEDLPD